jgi:type II secretory pathway predicted ATPase ExeA
MSDSLIRHFRLTAHPFGRDAAPLALHRHRGFVEAYERLRYTIELDGLSALVAEPGCGKSLLLGHVAAEQQKLGTQVHYFAHSTVGPFGLLNVLSRKLGQSPRRSRAETAQYISQAMLEDKRKHLLVLDEAHILPDATLEDVRLLTIADFDRRSPFVLILAGHPSLDDRLAEPTHHALDQRITTLARLSPLSLDETREYVTLRLCACGARAQPLFDDDAVTALFDGSAGVPRRLNRIASAAMIVAASRKKQLVGAQDVLDARLDRGRS